MSWLVTGAAGQLGTEIQLALKNAGVECFPLSSRELDITNETNVNEAIDKYRPEIILNAAAWTDVDRAETEKKRVFEVNADGPMNLAKASKNHGSTLIHISTDYVFSGIGKEPWQEDSETEPETIYGRSKLEGEKKVLEFNSEKSYIVRTAWLYSAHKTNFVKTMIDLATKDELPVNVVADQLGQPTYAKDLARQIVDLVNTQAKSGIYHGTNSGLASWYEFACEIFELCARDSSRVIPVRSSEYTRPAKRPQFSVLGHASWENSGVTEMRHWKLALSEAMGEIYHVEKTEA